MMMSLLPKVFSRRLAQPTRVMIVARSTLVRAMTTRSSEINDKVPTKPNPEGPVLGGYQEFLDDMITKTERMEAHMEELTARTSTYGTTIKWMDPADIDALMDLAATHKREMQEQLQAMKENLEAAKTNFAVDGPDGECDGHLEEEFEEVKHIVEDEAAAHKAA